MGLAEFGGRQPSEAVARYLGGVIDQLLLCLFAYFSEVVEGLYIRRATSEASNEALGNTRDRCGCDFRLVRTVIS